MYWRPGVTLRRGVGFPWPPEENQGQPEGDALPERMTFLCEISSLVPTPADEEGGRMSSFPVGLMMDQLPLIRYCF